MSFYSERVLPHLLNLAMRHKDLAAYRSRVVPAAQGRVLEIGVGSGLNLPIYGVGVTEVIGLDPSPSLLRLTERHVTRDRFPVNMVLGPAEAIPLEDAGLDTVLTTWTLCSIPQAAAALSESAAS